MRFPEIKEAFYAHCAVLIEGETEYGCINAFADKLGVPLNDYGICVCAKLRAYHITGGIPVEKGVANHS